MPSKSLLRSALIGLLASTTFLSVATAHSWVEQLMVIAPNGTMVGQPGFPRGNVLRSTPGFGDPAMVNLIPPDGRPANQIQPQDLMCKISQSSQTQTDGSPRLQAAPGSAVGLRYQENGHVSLPGTQAGKPQNRGTVYVYGTTQPSPDDSFLAIHRVWTPDGSGGDRRGVLLSTQNFDDGQCYQVNGGAISSQRQGQYGHPFNMVMGSDLWCQQDIQIPTSAPSGKPYTLYWVWDWPTLPGTPGFPEGKQEIYTTCMDIDITSDFGVEIISKAQGSAWIDQPADQAAIKAQVLDIANPTAVTGQTIPFTETATFSPPAPSSSSQMLTTSSTGSTIAFSASATGPVAGAASDASVALATHTATGEPDFLTVHTGSTAGPGVETQTFTVQPIAATAAAGQGQGPPNGGGGRGGRGKNTIETSNRAGRRFKLIIHANGPEPEITSVPAINNQAGVLTLTEYDSVTETVYETVYQTMYTKRDAGQYDYSTTPLPDYPSPAGASTEDGPWSRIGKHFGHGRPAWATGTLPGNWTWEQHNNASRGAWFSPLAPSSAFYTTQASATADRNSAATGYVMTMPGGTVMTVSAEVETELSTAAYASMDSASPTLEARAEATDTSVVTLMDLKSYGIQELKPTGAVNSTEAHIQPGPSNRTSTWGYARSAMPHHPHSGIGNQGVQQAAQGCSQSGSAYTSNSWDIGAVHPDATSSGASFQTFPPMESDPGSGPIYKRFAFQNHLLTTSAAVPRVTSALSIGIRATDPEPASTAHSAFRLRARNPFVWLGWQQDKDEEAQPTPTLHL
ncbi:uncharacterized protein A1O9_10632 [Exophiala aquamarina CBS 119918]|uniref:DUF7492 domain-containing protein n=1 Tax=Exophiala aquamarina CBS 119918 TaxID=1182545 RepID=A0A072NZ72_9EURO|nr:uncharacterized protein A1O9_10632 [Exophiala aquamarina CBS 119918]KEF53184.1 hypothetical protein A1O9_10632 [Exophiala aquamarina CBS 119918]